MLENFLSACQTGNITLVRSCLADPSFDPNQVGHPRNKLLFGASKLSSSTPLSQANNNGKTGLMYACEKGHTEIVRLLLQDSRIDVNTANNEGRT